MTDCVIEHGIPIPKVNVNSKTGQPPKYPFGKMAIGDSIFVMGLKDGLRAANAAHNLHLHLPENRGKKFMTRTEIDRYGALGRRIWRVQ